MGEQEETWGVGLRTLWLPPWRKVLLASRMPYCRTPSEDEAVPIVDFLYSFARERPINETAYNIQMNRHTIGDMNHEMRCLLLEYLDHLDKKDILEEDDVPLDQLLDRPDRRLGSTPGSVVCADCTFRSKKKVAKGGFQGRSSTGHQTTILGLVELDGSGLVRHTTGRVKLVLVHGENGISMQEAIAKYVADGAEIWTDGGGAWAWLTGAGYVHEKVIHNRKQFSKIVVYSDHAKLVSTNAVEGLFGMVKVWFRQRNVHGITKAA